MVPKLICWVLPFKELWETAGQELNSKTPEEGAIEGRITGGNGGPKVVAGNQLDSRGPVAGSGPQEAANRFDRGP